MINSEIRANEVRLIGSDGGQLGIVAISEALNQARNNSTDLSLIHI